VTFRLADSLPKQVITRLMREKAQRLLSAEKANDPKLVETIERDYAREIERHLDKGIGACALRRPEVAELAARALQFFDRDRYQLRAWVVMPNHVHVVFSPAPNCTVSAIVKSWKSFIALHANRILHRTGDRFWQPESYDHWIRNDEEHLRCCRYVHNNPVKAGLCRMPEQWRWSSAWQPQV
jgi:REP element-mobilizing transposase RayT